MTEPVAYRVDGTIYNDIKDAEFAVREIEHLRSSLGMDNGLIRRPICIEPLYTADQLHPRVKMTQAEFDEFHDLFEKDFDLYSAMTALADTNLFATLYDRLFTGTNTDKEKQNEFAILWDNYDPENPEETIEIVPDMKWFVRSKEVQSEDDYFYLINPGQLFPLFTTNIERAGSFSTKEEAEHWTNPLTEAVQLPVEDK